MPNKQRKVTPHAFQHAKPKPYVPTGRPATPGMLEMLARKVNKKRHVA